MKVFFDTNFYVAEALLGKAAQEMIKAVLAARWRVYTSRYLLEELGRVLVDELGFSRRQALRAQRGIKYRSSFWDGTASAIVPGDAKDSPILQAAVGSGADYLVTNDRHLLALHPYEGLRIVSMTEFYRLLRREGLID